MTLVGVDRAEGSVGGGDTVRSGDGARRLVAASSAFIQNRYMQTPFWRAALQVVVGGALVFAAGILIGSA